MPTTETAKSVWEAPELKKIDINQTEQHSGTVDDGFGAS